jgi:hypothetical protein
MAAAKPLRDAVENQTQVSTSAVPTVNTLVEQYREEKMPQRFSTRHGYNAWLNNHVILKWGACEITDVQARPVELLLQSLTLAPKSRVAIRGLLGILWDFAMWRGDGPTQRNPMELRRRNPVGLGSGSCSRSSNRTGRFPASGSRKRRTPHK